MQVAGTVLPTLGRASFLERGSHSLWMIVFQSLRLRFIWKARHSRLFYRDSIIQFFVFNKEVYFTPRVERK